MMLKFVPLEESTAIDWIDGSKIKCSRPKREDVINLYRDGKGTYSGILRLCLSGWEGIEKSDSGSVLEFNEENATAVCRYLENDIEFLGKFKIWYDGPLKNS